MEVGNSEKPAKQGYSLSQISLVAALVEGIIVFLQGDWPFYPALFVCFYRNLHHVTNILQAGVHVSWPVTWGLFKDRCVLEKKKTLSG